jgi:hypothetical protein
MIDRRRSPDRIWSALLWIRIVGVADPVQVVDIDYFKRFATFVLESTGGREGEESGLGM